MRGITEERLRRLLSIVQDEIYRLHIRDLIATECTELNPWQPIDENTPKDRRIRLFYPASENGEYDRLVIEKTYTNYFKLHSERLPTHWQELPEDPK